MPAGLQNIVRLRPPFKGVDRTSPPSVISPVGCYDSSNIIVSRGTIDVRPPYTQVVSGVPSTLLDVASDTFYGTYLLYPFMSKADGSLTTEVVCFLSCSFGWDGGVAGTFTEQWSVNAEYGPGSLLKTYSWTTDLMNRPIAESALGKVFIIDSDPSISGLDTHSYSKLYFMNKLPDASSITAPTALSTGGGTIALAAGGSLTVGTNYTYKITYYDSANILESAFSGVSSTMTPTAGNQTVNITCTASGQANVDYVRIYRRAGSSGPWEYLGQHADDGGTYADDGATSVTSGWRRETLGITAPASITTALQAGGSLTDGERYSYRYTFYNENAGTESGPSPVSSWKNATAVNAQVEITWTASTDTQVTHARIYRLQDGVDDTWFLLGSALNATASYTDDGSVTPAKEFTERLNVTSGTPDRPRAICWHKGRMWYAPQDENGTVVHSEYGLPEQVNPLNSYDVGESSESVVIKMESWKGSLIIFTTIGIWGISGDSPEDFVSEQITRGDGLYSPYSVCHCDDDIYYMSCNGIVKLGVGGIKRLNIAARASSSGLRSPTRTSATFDTNLGVAIFNVPALPNSATEAYQIVIDPTSDEIAYWTIPSSFVSQQTQSAYGYAQSSSMFSLYVSGSTIGKIVELSYDNSDNRDLGTTGVSYYWESGDIDLGLISEKAMYYLGFAWEYVNATDAITFGHKVDSAAAWTTSASTLNAAPPVHRHAVSSSGRRLRFKISGTATKPTRFVGIDIDAEPRGFQT